MSVPLQVLEEKLPEGVMYETWHFKYRLGAFLMGRKFLMLHPRFDWRCHIRDTFHDCMKPMTDRFMKVV